MTGLTGATRVAAMALVLCGSNAWAQSPKELKTKSGTPVVLVNFLSPRPDCSSNPGPIALPVVREKPASGVVQLLTIASDVPASDKCPARKIPSTALIYVPNKDFIGSDSVVIDVEVGNRTTLLSYKITVQAAAERL